MAARPDLYPFEANLHYFDSVVRSAQETLVAQIELAISTGQLKTASQRAAQLGAVEATLANLTGTATPLAVKAVREAWDQASNRALAQIHALPVETREDARSFSGVSREAVQQMQTSLSQRLDSAAQTLGRRVEDVYARETRRTVLRSILGAAASPDTASRELQERLMRDRDVRRGVEDGRTGFVDSSGRRWTLQSYSNMAVRTTTREAVVQGAVTRMVSHGILVARVSTHPGACEICQPFEGTLVALGPGAPSEYEGEAVSDTGEQPPYHPNCAHSLMPVAATIDSLRRELATQGATV